MALNLNYEPNVLVENTDAITREEWLKWRAMGIGGSDVAAALGFSPYKTRRDLYYEKSGIEPAISDEENNWVAKEVGKRLESLVADMYGHLILKESVVDGVFDDDLRQVLYKTLLSCIRAFEL